MEPFAAAIARITAGLNEYIATRQLALNTLFLARFLPPVPSTEAEIKRSNFRIVTEPAALTAVDSPYAKVGSVRAGTFNGETFKITAESKLSESDQDTMHARANAQIVRAYRDGNIPSVQNVYEDFITRVVDDGVSLSLDYGEEVFRAIALATGKIDVVDANTGNAVQIDYKVPSNHKVARTAGESYDQAGSKFWDDVDAARQRLQVEPVGITDPNTAAKIKNQAKNGIIVLDRQILSTTVTMETWVKAATNVDGSFNMGQRSLDVRLSVTIYIYGGKGDAENAPYFWPQGRLTFLRLSSREVQLIDGQVVRGALGVTHIGPNTEQGQESRRHIDVYRPQGRAYEVIAQGAEDIVPDIQEARNLFLAQTELTA